MSFEQRVSEPKLSKCGTMMVRTVKVGNKLIGKIEAPKVKPGEKSEAIFWASEDVMYLSARDACIYVSRPAVANLRTYGVVFVGVKYPSGTSYSTPLTTLAAPEVGCSDHVKPSFRVPLSMWTETLPPEAKRVATVLEKMRIAGGRGQSAVTSVK